MNHQQMWKAYCEATKSECEYFAWAFGADPDTLAQLVLDGIKTGTASLHIWYENGSEPIPKVGDHSIVLDSKEEAVCIIRTTNVYTVPFDQVTEKHAYLEGEGDRSLTYWREVHEAFFTEELKSVNLPFSRDLLVVCEEFEKVYP